MKSEDSMVSVDLPPAEALELAATLERLVRGAGAGGQQPGELADPAAAVYDSRPVRSSAAGRFPYPEHVATLVWRRLQELEVDYSTRGRSLRQLGPASELAERMVATLPSPSPWDDLLGPFYGPGQMARALGGISRQAIADRRRRGTLLGLQTADGRWVYPTFQFTDDLMVIEGLPEVLQTFKDAPVDGWTLAGWLKSSFSALEGLSPVEWLHQGRDLELLRVLARDAAQRFAQ